MKIMPPSPALLATAVALSFMVTTASAQPPAKARAYGQGNPFQVSDLPAGQLRSQLEKLSPESRAKAMDWLNGFHFHTHDVPFLRTDKDGGIFYADGFTAEGNTADATTSTADGSTSSSTIAVDAFKLHSKPGSSKVIYLDFDGHTITGTAWNSGSASTFNAVPYDLDGNPATFSSAETANIAEIWRRIAEDYAPFDVDVTTELPASFGPTVGRILVTKDTDANGQAMPAQGAGGVAYVNVFGRSDYASYYSPALVYYNRLGNGQPDYVSEAASHEMGHNMGLSHDGTSTQAYYGGHGSGNISWGPIMGTGYYRNVSQWSKGEYTDANNSEDDVAIITNKVKARPDDHADQTSAATPLSIDSAGNVSSTSLVDDPDNLNTANKGIIGSRNDVDVFSFSTSGGAVTLQAMPARESRYTRGGDLDISMSVYDRNGALVANNDPADDTLAAVSANLPAGMYYLTVEGVGSANYSDYGSLGRYSISGTIPQASDTNPPTPNPMGWATAPYAVDYQSVKMTAVTAQDDMSSVSYYFACTSGGSGCKDSGWVSSPTYTLSGLAASTTYSFTVKARDGAGNETNSSGSATVTTPDAPVVNQPPVASADSATVATGAMVTIPVLDNDSDPDGDSLTITSVSKSSKGTAATDGAQVTYKAGSRKGGDSFTYTISDGHGNTATATVSVSITSSATGGGRNSKTKITTTGLLSFGSSTVSADADVEVGN